VNLLAHPRAVVPPKLDNESFHVQPLVTHLLEEAPNAIFEEMIVCLAALDRGLALPDPLNVPPVFQEPGNVAGMNTLSGECSMPCAVLGRLSFLVRNYWREKVFVSCSRPKLCFLQLDPPSRAIILSMLWGFVSKTNNYIWHRVRRSLSLPIDRKLPKRTARE
jgi:hypothetical protein